MKVAIFSQLWPEALAQLQTQHQCLVSINPNDAEKRRLLAAAEIVVVRGPVKLDSAALESAPALRLIIRAGMGLDGIDLAAAEARGLRVVTAPLSEESVAEHTFALMLSLYRRIPWYHRSLQENRWEKHHGYNRDLFGKQLGLVGFGRIGIRTAEIAQAFAMKICAFDRSPAKAHKQEAAARLQVRFMKLNELLHDSDIVAIQAPLLESTRNLIAAPQFALMKTDAILINVGRGGIVVEEDLYTALTGGRLGGAALDVFSVEPSRDNPLLTLDNFIGTPHVAGQTLDAQAQIGDEILRIIHAYEAGRPLTQFNLAT